ncbi:MAG: fimbria/pilus outer membrane usher protein, partial [Hyphomonadaceae bacterium]
HDGEEVRTFALSYAPRPVRYGRFDLQVMHVAAAESITTVGVRVVATLGHDVSANAQLERDQTRWNAAIAAQRAAPAEIGFGWRASARTGERDRIDANVTHLGSSHEAALEVSHTEISSGLRGRYAAGFAWMNGALMAARPIRGSFALVDVGAPGVRVLRDRRFAALSNAHGRALVTGLRTYEVNPIGIDLDQSPFNLSFARDEIAVVPAARSGALVRFAQQSTGAGQVRVVAATGAPLPPGALLTRESDGARFPIGSNGRAYFTGVGEAARYVSSSGCSFLLDATGLRGGGEIACAA